jgi:hypothetical protein
MSIASVGAVVLLSLAGMASADVVIPLGGGWEAVLATNTVSLTPHGIDDSGALHISKEAVFRSNDPFTGAPEPVIITFRQVLPDNLTSSTIIIDDEMIMNLTGQNWTGYRQVLALSNQVAFNPVSLGMSVGPEFTTNTLTPDFREMDSSGGPGVANGAMWMPGAIGDLVININLGGSDSPIVFVLKEIPVVPTPGAAALGVAGLMAMGRRRR